MGEEEMGDDRTYHTTAAAGGGGSVGKHGYRESPALPCSGRGAGPIHGVSQAPPRLLLSKHSRM